LISSIEDENFCSRNNPKKLLTKSTQRYITTFVHVKTKECFEKLNKCIKEPLNSGNLATNALKGRPSGTMKIMLGAIYEPRFLKASYGFRLDHLCYNTLK
jgi:hypothetical protein